MRKIKTTLEKVLENQKKNKKHIKKMHPIKTCAKKKGTGLEMITPHRLPWAFDAPPQLVAPTVACGGAFHAPALPLAPLTPAPLPLPTPAPSFLSHLGEAVSTSIHANLDAPNPSA